MTDLPAASRAELTKALLPGLLTAQREQQADHGTTVKTLWRAADGAYLESVLMRYPGRVTMCVSSQAGCGMALPVLRDRPGRADPQPVHRGDRRAGRRRRPGAGRRPGRRRPRPGVQRGVHGHGRAAGQLQPACVAAVQAADRPGPGRPGHVAAAITVSTVGLVPAMRKLAAEELSVTPRCVAARALTMSCATSSCRSTGAGRSPRCSTRPGITRPRPGGGSRSSTR